MALAKTGSEQFESLLDLYGEAIESLFGDAGPSAIAVCFQEFLADLRVQNTKLSYLSVRRYSKGK